MKDTSKAAKPIELVIRGGDPNRVVMWACGTCRIPRATEEMALECCLPNVCDECKRTYTHYCIPCNDAKEEKKEEAAYNAARKVPTHEYQGDALYCDCCDAFYADVDDLMDSHEEGDEPSYAWGVTEELWKLDAENVVDSQYEGMLDDIGAKAMEELQTALDSWTTSLNIRMRYQDESIVVDLSDYEN